MSVSIIIPTRNRAKILKTTLNALVKQIDQKDEVLVIDNGSVDNTKEVVFSFQSHFPIKYFFESRKGPSFARNLGVKKAKGEIIAFLDDDCIPCADWLLKIKVISCHSPKDIVYQGKIIHYFSKKSLLSELFILRNKQAWKRIKESLGFKNGGYLDFLNAGNFFLKKKILEKLDYVFDSKIFPFIGEERDLAARLGLAGIKIVYIPKVVVKHLRPQPRGIFDMPKIAFLHGRAEGILEAKYAAKPKIKKLFKKEMFLFSRRPNFFKRIWGSANHFFKKGLIIYLGTMGYLITREIFYALGRVFGRMEVNFQRLENWER